MSLEAAGDPADRKGIYKERTELKIEMRYRGIVLVASEDSFLISGLHGLAPVFHSLISHLVL